MAIELEYCEYQTGLPHRFVTLLVGIETNGDYIQFYADESVHVDWGSGKFLEYPPGIVYGKQVFPKGSNPADLNDSKPVEVRSYEEVTVLKFGTLSRWDRNYHEINIAKAPYLKDAEKMCYRLEEMHTFKFFGNNKIESFESAWEDCTELLHFDGMDTTRCLTMKRAWKNCNKLVEFPMLYAKKCLTVEEAWMGCTAMLGFPLMDVSNCLNFDSAWRGNDKLWYFPYIDTGSGTSFNHSWAYCTSLTYFPQLDFEDSLSMDHTFAYMKSIRNMPDITAELSVNWKGTFLQMCSLRCIEGVNSLALKSLTQDASLEMFDHTQSLLSPGKTEQAAIRAGYDYNNGGSCFYDAGRSVFFVHIELLESYCSNIKFTLTGGDFEVDWGDGVYLHYNEGIVENIPIGNRGINIRSEENITNIEFHTDVMTNIEFKRANTVTDVKNVHSNGKGMCQDLLTLQYFEILGETKATDYSEVLSGCISLVKVGEMSLTYALTVEGLCRNCILLEDFGLRYYDVDNDVNIYDPISAPVCISFREMFYGCYTIERIQTVVSTLGQDFTRTFANMENFTCLEGIDTKNNTVTLEMFLETPILVRPTEGEQDDITAIPGVLYSNGGNCGGPTTIIFKSNGLETTFQLDGPVTVDWGDGNFIHYPANTDITGTLPVGEIGYILGDSTTIDWKTDTIEDVVFIRAEKFTSMANMFEGHQVIRDFTLMGDIIIEDYTAQFKDSSVRNYEVIEDLGSGKIFTDMFRDTPNLDTVSPMNTYNGEQFEGMFQDSGLHCLGEVNTLKAIFPPAYINCNPGDTIDCSDGAFIECYQSSTMFLNATPTFPTAGEIYEIIHHSHWISTTPCEGV